MRGKLIFQTFRLTLRISSVVHSLCKCEAGCVHKCAHPPKKNVIAWKLQKLDLEELQNRKWMSSCLSSLHDSWSEEQADRRVLTEPKHSNSYGAQTQQLLYIKPGRRAQQVSENQMVSDCCTPKFQRLISQKWQCWQIYRIARRSLCGSQQLSSWRKKEKCFCLSQ